MSDKEDEDLLRELQGIIAKNVRATRHARGLSQPDLSERTGITQANISLIERGQAMPQVPTLVKLARALRTKVDLLLKSRDL